MASAARGESSNQYGGGLGNGGKFRKPTARKSQRTPYERPATSVRSSGLGNGGEARGGGWLSKLVDPAQRLITYSAHRLFASVFRKRLGSGESPVQSPEQQKQQLPERDVNQETNVGHTENTSSLLLKNDLVRKEDTVVSVHPSKDGFTDLEKMLKEKTFTRSEVDRLTTLLRTKAGDSSTVNREQRNEVSTVRNQPSHETDRLHRDSGSINALVSTPLGSSRALDECIASPAQLAKEYMGSRPSEVTPSMLGLRGQAVREDSVFMNRTPFPSKSPTMSLLPKPSGQRLLENGFVTPRTRGRSAVYSMARTSYSRPQSTVKIGSLFQASPSKCEEGLSSGSRQGHQSGLKRRSSVLDNDIGSVGPVRRIRQKSNLSSRSLALPAAESPLSVRASGGPKSTHTSKNSAEDISGSSYNVVPTQSSEVASKILQQLGNLIATREKSPSKLSPSMLRGPALKSLQNVEAPKFVDNLPEKEANSLGSSYHKQDKSRQSASREGLVLNEKTGGSGDGTSKAGSSNDQDSRKGSYLPLTSSVEEHPPKKRAFRMSADEDFLELDDDHHASSTPLVMLEKQNASGAEKSVASIPKGEKPTLSEAIPSTSYVSNGNASQGTPNGSLDTGRGKFATLPVEAVQQGNMASEPISKFIQGTENLNSSPAKQISEEKVIPLEEPKKAATVFPNIFSSPAATGLLNQNTGASADIKLEKTTSSAFGVSEASAKPTETEITFSNSTTEPSTSSASTLNGVIFSGAANTVCPPLNNGSEVPSTLQSFAASPAASSLFGNFPANTSNDSNSGSNSKLAPAFSFSSSSPFKFGEPASSFPASSSPASTVPASSGHISKETEVKNSTSGNVNSFKFGSIASADTSTGNVFAAKCSENKSTPGFVFGSAGSNSFGGTSSVGSGSTLSSSTAATSASGSSGSLIFGVASSSTPVSETSKFSLSSTASTGSNILGTSTPAFTSSTSSMFGSVPASTTSNVFGFDAASSAPSASSQSQPQASNFFSAANAQTGNTGSGTTTSTQSVPFQFASSTSAPSFGFSASTSVAAENSPFGVAKSEPAVFGSGSATQLSSTNSSASSSGTTSSSLFGGTNWQTANSAPAFGSSFTTSSSPTFNFGGTSAATGPSASAPIFGASTNTPSSSSVFSFNSTSPAIPQQPVFGNTAPSTTPSQSPFGNSTPGFSFGAAAPQPNTNGMNNNQQMSMEDSMAEDTDQGNKAPMVQPVFGQAQPMSQPSFGFGGGAPAQTPSFGGAPAPSPSMANPFQFGGQPSAGAPQNVSPFSQSLEQSSFSLGSNGGGDKSSRRIVKVRKTNRKR